MKKLAAIACITLLFASCGQWKEKYTIEKKANSGAYLAGFYDAKDGCVVGYGGVINYTTEGNKMKTGWNSGNNHSMCLFGLEAIDSKTFIACGNGANVVVSKDGGASWSHVAKFGGQEPGQCRLSSFADATTGWIATTTKIGETRDFGGSWQEIAFDAKDGILLSVCCVGPGKGFAFTNKGNIIRTDNAGATWTIVGRAVDPAKVTLRSGMLRLQQIAQLRMKGNDGVLAFVNDVNNKATIHVLSTADGGKTWKTELEKKHVLSTVFISPDMRYITTLNYDKTVTLFESSRRTSAKSSDSVAAL